MRNTGKKAAVFPSQGIGDALLMMILCHQLQKAGYKVTCFYPLLQELQSWFSPITFTPLPSLADLKDCVKEYDVVFVENDNSSLCKKIYAHVDRDLLHIFYPTYQERKHFPLTKNDVVFSSNLSMTENIAQATASFLGSLEISKDNGIRPPAHLIHRKEKNRVLLHPFSRDEEKNWPLAKYEKLAKQLQKNGFDPTFIFSEKERSQIEELAQKFQVKSFPTLDELASFVYESGYMIGNDSLIGHLASNLQIPTIIIANDPKRMKLWRPGWLTGEVVTPPSWIPNSKCCRLREKYWKNWICPAKVFRLFRKRFAVQE